MTEKRFYNDGKYVMQNGEVYVVCGGEHSADVVATALNELLDETEQLKKDNEHLETCFKMAEKRINRLEKYIKSDFIDSVCDNCKHMKAYRTSNWFNGVDEDIECLKGHEDMDIDDCIDFEIDLGRYE